MVNANMNQNKTNIQSENELNFADFLMRSDREIVFWLTPDAEFVYVNDTACNFIGCSREELLTLTLEDIDPNFTPEVWAEVWETLIQQGSIRGRYLYQNRDKKVIPVEVTAHYLKHENKEICCVFIDELVREKPQESITSIFPNSPKLNEVFRFIEANYHQPITLCDVAQAVDYSSAYLTDLVRQETGKTVNQWIVERRIVEAQRLLLETDQTVKEIAISIGYQYEGHFFRQFRKYHGTTPQVWRNWQRTQLIVERNLKNC
jgi:PAS domain S-box-containing protein